MNISHELQHIHTLIVSTALMSIARYVIDSFESIVHIAQFPELISFRMMRMIVNALDCRSIEDVPKNSVVTTSEPERSSNRKSESQNRSPN
jgi:hypothetical protein